MDRFSFVMVLLSIIVGLGLKEILMSVAAWINNRETISGSWLLACTAALIIIALLQQWWEFWPLNQVESWNFPIILLMLGGPACLYIIAHLLFPTNMENVDLEEHYFTHSREIWIVGIAANLFSTLFRPVGFGSTLFSWDNATSFGALMLFLILAISKNRIVHYVIAPLLLAGLLADILIFIPAI